MKQEVKIGQTDYTVLIYIPDSASTDGSGKTGLAAANLTVSYTRVETDNDVVVTDATGSLNDLAALTSAHADWGLKEVSNTLAPGLYRLDIADAVFASGAWSAVVYVMVTTSAAAASPMEFVLTPQAPIDGVNVQAITAGAITSGVFASGAITADAIAANAIGASEIADGAIDAATFAAGAIDATAIANGAIDAATFAAGAIDAAALAADAGTEIGTAVWASAARSLTVLDEDSTTLDLDATIRAAVGLAAANLDMQIGDLPTNAELSTALAAADDAVLAAIAALTIPTANQNADALLDRSDAVETGLTPRGALRLSLAALGGKVSGGGTGTETFRNAVADSKDRIVATVDANGNRTAITTDVS